MTEGFSLALFAVYICRCGCSGLCGCNGSSFDLYLSILVSVLCIWVLFCCCLLSNGSIWGCTAYPWKFKGTIAARRNCQHANIVSGFFGLVCICVLLQPTDKGGRINLHEWLLEYSSKRMSNEWLLELEYSSMNVECHSLVITKILYSGRLY